MSHTTVGEAATGDGYPPRMNDRTPPSVSRINHISLTVRDLEASVGWYQRVFGFQRFPGTIPHYEREETGYAVLLIDPSSGVGIGLHTNQGNQGRSFDEAVTGLDHVSFQVEDHAQLERWDEHLTAVGVQHTRIRDLTEGLVYSTVVFRDPDNIQLELICLG